MVESSIARDWRINSRARRWWRSSASNRAMRGPLSTMNFLGASGMNSCSGYFFGPYRQVALSALVTAKQALSQLPGGRLMVRLRQIVTETFADQLGFGNPPGFCQRGEPSLQLVIETQGDGHESVL